MRKPRHAILQIVDGKVMAFYHVGPAEESVEISSVIDLDRLVAEQDLDALVYSSTMDFPRDSTRDQVVLDLVSALNAYTMLKGERS